MEIKVVSHWYKHKTIRKIVAAILCVLLYIYSYALYDDKKNLRFSIENRKTTTNGLGLLNKPFHISTIILLFFLKNICNLCILYMYCICIHILYTNTSLYYYYNSFLYMYTYTYCSYIYNLKLFPKKGKHEFNFIYLYIE